MNLYPWAMLVGGLLIGAALMKAYRKRKEKDLVDALSDLILAIESGPTDDAGRVRRVALALAKARKALER
jgi:LPXTG-motif cell wall-anchored protein